jgi:hypothetical protein
LFSQKKEDKNSVLSYKNEGKPQNTEKHAMADI